MSAPEKAKEGWSSASGYIWSMIGSAVGFANILSFSAHCYKNGGGAFLLLYFLALFTLGVPLLMLEGAIGKTWKLPLVTAYGVARGRWIRILGWLSVLACLTIGGFYVVLTGYSVTYTYFALAGQMPVDPAAFFKHTFLHVTDNVASMGALSWPVLTATMGVITLTWIVMVRQLSAGVEKICTIFMPLLALMMLLFAIFVTFLPGGISGWLHFLTPDFSRLSDVALWRDVFGQLLFSLSLGLGIIVGYSRHTGEDINIGRAMCCVAIGDFAVSFMAGGAIFGCIAYISGLQGVPFEQLMASDSTFEIGFILFPQLLQQFGGILGYLLSVVFFFSIFIAGITGVFSIIESIAGNAQVEFNMPRRRAVSLTLLALTPLAFLFCFGNGVHLIDALAPLVVGTNMLLSSLALIAVFKWWTPAIGKAPLWFNGKRPNFASLSLTWIVAPLLVWILIGSIADEFQSATFSTGLRTLWLLSAITVAIWFSRRPLTVEQAALSGAPLTTALPINTSAAAASVVLNT